MDYLLCHPSIFLPKLTSLELTCVFSCTPPLGLLPLGPLNIRMNGIHHMFIHPWFFHYQLSIWKPPAYSFTYSCPSLDGQMGMDVLPMSHVITTCYCPVAVNFFTLCCHWMDDICHLFIHPCLFWDQHHFQSHVKVSIILIYWPSSMGGWIDG